MGCTGAVPGVRVGVHRIWDTTKLPEGESAWDMERTRYGNGYAEKTG